MIASTVAMAGVTVPYLWVLFVMWNGRPDVLRNVYQNGYGGNFYDLQARALLGGHLYVPPGALAIESWVRGGHDYTYFGLFPSVLRMPVMLVTHQLDGHMTALSLLAAWLVTGVFTSMLLWRVRIMLRGDSMLGLFEATSMGVVVAATMGGSVLVYLGANPYVYSEDKAWSVALALGGFVALLGMLERPSWGRVATSAALIVSANLTRVTEGYACVIGALLIALWFALGRRGPDLRRWWWPMVGIAIVSVGAGCAVTWFKFGTLFGLPVMDYTAFHALGERHINGGRYFDPIYFPSAVWAYMQPGGLRFTSIFPYITLPAGPTRVFDGVAFDNRTRTASLTASMPLLFLLSCLGVVAAFRRHRSQVMRSLRLVLIASISGTAAVLFYGWIANRYLADFMPFLIVASTLGLIALWHFLEGQSMSMRMASFGAIAILGVFSVVANVALSITPTDSWTPAQATRFLQVQNHLSNLTGHPLAGQILKGDILPFWAPADTVFIAGNCNALYVSNGEDYRGVLDQRAEHRTWVVAEKGAGYVHRLKVTFGRPDAASQGGVPIVTFGHATVLMHTTPAAAGLMTVWFSVRDPHFPSNSFHFSAKLGTTHLISVETDRYADVVTVSFDDFPYIVGPITATGLPSVRIVGDHVRAPFDIAELKESAVSTPLCHTLSRAIELGAHLPNRT